MSVVEQILIIQEHDCKIREMEKELKDIPARKAERKGRLAEYTAAVAEAKEQFKAQQADVKKVELDIQTKREKVTKLRQQQLELKTNKDFKTMEEEIKGVELEISCAEDRELVLMEAMDAGKTNLASKEKRLIEEEAEVQREFVVLDERAGGIQKDVDDLKGKRAGAVVGVNAEWVAQYEKIFKWKDRALVPLNDGNCGGCHMKQPPATAHATRKPDAMVICGQCGRMLYSRV